MNATALRWSSIDGKTWTASHAGMAFEIELIQEPGQPDIYTAIYRDIQNGGDWEYQGQFDTISEAKASYEEHLK